ncbi:MAG: hypothetical protein J5J06_17785 [Phycisphaerae bacterium]|nr:hypothetical protein [Phycisphaerae bacterium]
MDDALSRMIGKPVVLDTGTPIVFIGTLEEIGEHVFVLASADMHDCRDGHANKEHYLADTFQDGVTVNRRRIVVMRNAIISVSLLEDIVTS